MDSDELKIVGKQIFLRRIRLSDVNDNYHSWLNDPKINQFLEVRHQPVSKQDIRDYITSLQDRDGIYFLAICVKSDARHIGNIKLGPIHPVHCFAEVSILIGDMTCWGEGYGTQAIDLLAGYAFGQLHLNRLSAGLYENNIGSYKAFRRAGFVKEGVFKKMRKYKDGFVDQVTMGIVREDWEKRSGLKKVEHGGV